MHRTIVLIGAILMSHLTMNAFSQKTIQPRPNQHEAVRPAGVYFLQIKGATKKNDPALPTGKLTLWKIKDSAYKIQLRYTGAPPARNLGIIDDTMIIQHNKASYISKEDKTCIIQFLFTSSSVTVTQQSEASAFACGFGRNVHIDGEYIKDKTASNALSPLQAGKIGLTLHWIGWEKRGIATITDPKNGFFQIQGKQTDPNSSDVIEMMGILHQTSPTEIVFEGIIKTQVSYINKGNVCERKGKYTFVAKPGKKYWRLKEQENCEGNMVVDYIDLYF